MANENNQNKCPNDCLRCSECQRIYCAATWTRTMHERMDMFEKRFSTLEDKIDALGKSDEGVFNPMESSAAELQSTVVNELQAQ